MIYVRKTNQDAIQFVTDFIRHNWLEQDEHGSYRYQNISFDAIKSPARRFKAFFLDEQEQRCCYCCRKIGNSSTELEHIIPRALNTETQFEPYYNHSNILRDNVVSQSSFSSAIAERNLPPFPHHIAYHNIVASCDGKTFMANDSSNFTCNRERKEKFIPPFNLMNDCVSYLSDGTACYNPDLPNQTYFNVLNLNKDILKQIRRLWYLFATSTLTLDNILEDRDLSIKEKIVLAVGNSTNTKDVSTLIGTFSNDRVWSIFKEYDFFYTYYQTLS